MLPVTEINALDIILRRLIGQQAWGVSVGAGSFLTMEFGKSLPPGLSGRLRGEWHLWLYGCAWRLEDEAKVLLGSEDPKPGLQAGIERLEGLRLLAVRLVPPALDAVFSFEEGVILRLFAVDTVEMESWKLFTPEEKVAIIGPGSQWIYRDAKSSSARPSVGLSGSEI